MLYNYLQECNLSKEKYKNVYLIQLYTGMRVGKVLALSLEDIDFDNSIIYVRKTVSVNHEGNLVVKQGTKTYAGDRELPLTDYLENSFKEQINFYEDNPEHLLFTYEGKIIKASTINTVLKRICKQIGLPSTISNHTLRHTYGARCIESGMLPVAVQKLMGHKDIRVTLNTYTTVLSKLKVDELNKVTKHYLENDLIAKTKNNTPIQITDSNITVNETSEKYTYDLTTDVVQKQISKEDITNYYKELSKWANRQYK